MDTRHGGRAGDALCAFGCSKAYGLNECMGWRSERNREKTIQKGVIITFGITFSFFPSLLFSPLLLNDIKAPNISPLPNTGLVGVCGVLPFFATS